MITDLQHDLNLARLELLNIAASINRAMQEPSLHPHKRDELATIKGQTLALVQSFENTLHRGSQWVMDHGTERSMPGRSNTRGETASTF